MRIHRVRLRNYRGVIDNTVEFPIEGVTIIEGANEIGKTCIPQAFDLIIKMPDSSTSKQVRDAKPVHRDEGPEVEIEVSSGDYRFVYWKRWRRKPGTTLTIKAPRRQHLTGRAAHDRVEEMLRETLDEELWRALRVGQWAGADTRRSGTTGPSFNVRSLADALDIAAGGEVTGDRADNLWERICAEREKYWTPTGRVKSERKSQERILGDAKEQVAELEQQLKEIESDANRVARLRSDRVRLADLRKKCGENERELRKQRELAEQSRSRVEHLESVHTATVAERDRIITEQLRRQDLVEALAARTDELVALETEARKAAPVVVAAIARSEEAHTARDEAHTALRSAEAIQRQANEDIDQHRRRVELDQLIERRQAVTTAQGVLGEAESHLESAKVNDELVDGIEQARIVVVRAEEAALSAGAQFEAIALSHLAIRIDGDEVMLKEGATVERVVTEQVEVLLPDVARLRIRAGVESRKTAADLANARAEYDHLCALGGVSNLAEARQAASDRREAERNRREAIRTIQRDLGDLTVEVLHTKIEGLSQRIDQYLAERPSHPPIPSSYEEAQLIASEVEQLVIEHQRQYGLSQVAAEFAAENRREEEVRNATLQGRIENARGAVQEARRLLARATEQRSDADLAEELDVANRKVETASEWLKRASAELRAADPASLQILLNNARAASRRALEDLQHNEREETNLRVSLELRGERGLYTRLGEARGEMRRLRREYERSESRARAAELLHARFAERRQEARHRYTSPLREQIEKLGRIVFGSTFTVELDDDLKVARRTLDGVTLDVDHLSAGAREQLGLLSRLACAVIVSPDGGGAPVIVDDALGWSDPERLEGMGAAIAAAGGECQIIVLTCTPGRYAHVGNARVIRLPT